MPTIYDFMKSMRYNKFKIAKRNGFVIFDKEINFDSLEFSITYGDTEQDAKLDELSEKAVISVNFELNTIYCDL